MPSKKKATDYLVWQPAWQDGWCRLGDLENVDELFTDCCIVESNTCQLE
jgi:hypothetical protein